MSSEEIIKELQEMAGYCKPGVPLGQALREAISLLRTHQDAQPNEPLRWRSCKKEKPTETGWYEVVQTRLNGAKARVTIAMYDPRYYDGDGWGYMNITQWRPLPDPPKEDAR